MAIEAKQQIRASDPAAPATLFAVPRVAMERRADGSLLTEVLWVEQHSGGSSRSVSSAA